MTDSVSLPRYDSDSEGLRTMTLLDITDTFTFDHDTLATRADEQYVADVIDDLFDDLLDPVEREHTEESPEEPRGAARCADGQGTLTHLFFSDDEFDIARAKAICARCALRESCLAGALEREEPWGVWGGELLSGGRIVFNKRPGGRPPKTPRPPVFVDELGVVPTVA